jgi:hypothetical protein
LRCSFAFLSEPASDSLASRASGQPTAPRAHLLIESTFQEEPWAYSDYLVSFIRPARLVGSRVDTLLCPKARIFKKYSESESEGDKRVLTAPIYYRGLLYITGVGGGFGSIQRESPARARRGEEASSVVHRRGDRGKITASPAASLIAADAWKKSGRSRAWRLRRSALRRRREF